MGFIDIAMQRLADSLSNLNREELLSRADAEPVVIYRLPGAPPVGRHVLTNNGRIFVRVDPHPDETYLHGDIGPWGLFQEVIETPNQIDQDLDRRPWGSLLAYDGPLTLLPAAPEDRAIAVLYGPAGARWGDPDTPCPYRGCVYGTFHTGAHIDDTGALLGQTTLDPGAKTVTAAVTRQDLETPCTCGTPHQHQPGCPRYQRITGQKEETS